MMTLSSSSFRSPGDAVAGQCPVCGAETMADHEAAAGLADPCTACGHRIWFRWEARGEGLSVRLGGLGIVTEQNIMRIVGRLDRAIHDGVCRAISLDFGPVTHVTSTTLAQLVGLKRRLDPMGGHMTLKMPEPTLRDIFRITRLDSVFDIEPVAASKA